MKQAKGVLWRACVLGLCLCLLLPGMALMEESPVIGDILHGTAIELARAQMKEAYGFDEALLLENFQEVLILGAEDDGACTVTYEPTHRADVLGVYTITLLPDGGVQASWTKDGADAALTASGAWEAPAWGPAQLARLAALDSAYAERLVEMVLEKGPLRGWSLEDRAALEQPLRDADYPVNRVYHSVPGPGDIPQASATQLAEAAIEAAYGVTASELSAYRAYTRFLYLPPVDDYIWRIDYTATAPDAAYGGFAVELETESGDVRLCAEMPGVQETDLVASQISVLTSMTRVEAIRIARERLMAETGFDDQILSLYPITVWYECSDTPVWHVSFTPEEPKLYEVLGAYTVTICAGTAQVVHVDQNGRIAINTLGVHAVQTMR